MGNKNKTIWIVNFHTAPPGFAFNPRYIKLVPYLQQAGYDVTIFSSAYLRRFDKFLTEGNQRFVESEYDGLKFVHIKSVKYSGNGLMRMISIFQFTLRLLFLRNKFQKPDIIYHNLHVPFDSLVYYTAKKLHARYVAEIWDLWPEYFHRMGLVNKNNPLLKIAFAIEKWMYTKADALVFSMEGGKDYLIEKGWDSISGGKVELNKTHYINNGVDLAEFDKNILEYRLDDQDLENDKFFNVIYLGSIHRANNLIQVINAANQLNPELKIKVLIYGDGPERPNLVKYCLDNKINNVIFKQKHIPFNQIPYVLSRSSLNIMNYLKDFGDYGVSSGKLFLYLASGKPIISNVAVKYCVIAKNNIGIAKSIETSEQYAEAILSIKNMPEQEYLAMCKRVKETAKQFDFKVLASDLLSILNKQ